LFIGFGPYAASKIDSMGMERNAFGALWPARVSRTHAGTLATWRMSPLASPPVTAFTSLKGAARDRNVVLILLESTAAQYLKPYGAAEDPMPNLTQLSDHSIVFNNAYAVYPESIRELFATLCSRYPLFGTATESYAGGPCSSLGEILHGAGYRTGLFHSGRFMYLGMQSVIDNRGFDTLEDAGAIGGNVNSSFGVDEPAAVSRILTWIDTVPADKRFFVTYIPVAGHHPYATPGPGPFPNDTDINSYRNALHYGDESLGTLFDGLRQRNLEQNTLYVIFGDHGEAFGQHEGNFGHSLFIYDENIRVPYIIAAPGLIRQTLHSSAVASVIDTAPTILDLLGLESPPGFQGESLVTAAPQMALFFTDYSLGFLGLRDACWKYILETGSRHSKLFNACQDPRETRDIAAGEPDRIQAYRSVVEGWVSEANVGR
jgi:phosphoglycerol transferase MdoB-like AlkP superfamily enzyme